MSGIAKTFEIGDRCIICNRRFCDGNTSCSRSVQTCQHVVVCDACFAESRRNGMNFCPVCRTPWPPFNPACPLNTEGFTGLIPDPNRRPGRPVGYVYDSGSGSEGENRGQGRGRGTGRGEASGSGSATGGGNRRRRRRNRGAMSGIEKTFEIGDRCIICNRRFCDRNTSCSWSVQTCQHVVVCDACFAESRRNGMNFCPVCRTPWPPFNPACPLNTEGFTRLIPDPNRRPGRPVGYVYDSGTGRGEASGSGSTTGGGNRRRRRRNRGGN